ncbi:hypothetical protein H4F44_26030, partial [Escherichia coli]|nr:hypothetical protein [Escherichia coli]
GWMPGEAAAALLLHPGAPGAPAGWEDGAPAVFLQPLALRRRERVMQELGLPRLAAAARPFVHVSGMLGAARGFVAVMWPLAQHPRNRNEIIAWD